MIAAPARLAALAVGCALAACGRSADSDPGKPAASASSGSAGPVGRDIADRRPQDTAAAPGTGGTLGITANGLPRSADDRGAARGLAGKTASGMVGAASAASGIADADKAFVVKAALSGLFEVEVSQQASARASASEVKAYATMLVNDHTQANNELAGLATVRGITLPTRLPQDLQAQLRKVSRSNGPAFDREFLRRVGFEAHRQDIDDFQAATGTLEDPQLKAWAEKTLPALRQHLSQAETLVQRTGGKA